REFEFSHRCPIGIPLAVVLKGLFPAACDPASGTESECVGFQIVLHEGIDVAAVPGLLLFGEDTLDFKLPRRGGLLRVPALVGTGRGLRKSYSDHVTFAPPEKHPC